MLIDLTHLIQDDMPVYPGDNRTEFRQTRHLSKDHYTNHQLSVNMHAGTHIDGPMHLLDTDKRLSDFPLDTFIGAGCVLDVTGEAVIDYKAEYEEAIPEHVIVLFHTGYSRRFGQEEYFTDYPVLTEKLAELLVRKQVKMVGLDTPSPDKYPFHVHKLLFRSGILIAENLTNLGRLPASASFEVIALPLHIGADSSVARVVARVL
ncbi:cyclase family protein [Paenibacillus sambharensis]|uniref:Cyclase family protein n=1 Tax=Paenibacillus sambharensis TaxID=1803190 RepID=A0A2W1LHN9_9BACL|nr:cyclase family protein [Paenibacillus sambharensis]PZD94475.1 cyclase family protein [Paenibacillus sambharensis]